MAAREGEGEEVYATLLLTDTYLDGALVLAHSLRDGGATRKLAVLVTTDTVSEDTVSDLKTVYDYVIPVPRIRNAQPANLQLMNRTDLHSAFTKINLWNQTQFRKVVYLDADVLAYRAPEELFGLAHPFSAAPDIGWPDLFNTGVMVLTPNTGDYYAMMAMAERGISFDGADQGLINTHFRNNYNRISFAYNVTPSAHYQYIPAYRHFQSTINMVHFIGADKPWFRGRDAGHGSSSYDEMLGRWWSVYDRHYRGQNGSRTLAGWDAQRQSPPVGSKPEGLNFPSKTYEMSRDTTPFVAPQQHHGGSYQAPLRPIFPWEANRPKPSRIFAGEGPPAPQIPQAPGKDTPSTPTSEFPEPPPSVDGSVAEASTVGSDTSPSTPTSRTAGSESWTSYTRTNAWDEVPEIERYVNAVHQRTRSFKSKNPGVIETPAPGTGARPRRGSKVTDFPSEVERPSLPVTPAPVRRPNFWGGDVNASEDGGEPLLPAAAGVPGQSDWVRVNGN